MTAKETTKKKSVKRTKSVNETGAMEEFLNENIGKMATPEKEESEMNEATEVIIKSEFIDKISDKTQAIEEPSESEYNDIFNIPIEEVNGINLEPPYGDLICMTDYDVLDKGNAEEYGKQEDGGHESIETENYNVTMIVDNPIDSIDMEITVNKDDCGEIQELIIDTDESNDSRKKLNIRYVTTHMGISYDY